MCETEACPGTIGPTARYGVAILLLREPERRNVKEPQQTPPPEKVHPDTPAEAPQPELPVGIPAPAPEIVPTPAPEAPSQPPLEVPLEIPPPSSPGIG